MTDKALDWFKVLQDPRQLPEGRVMTVTAGTKPICLTHYEGHYNALDNKCPHQGGPLGEGSIENGLLRCPWHGWDYDPCSGKAPGFDDGVETFPIDIRDDGIYVGLTPEPAHEPTVSDIMVGTMTNAGVDTVFGMVGHSNLGLADAFRRAEERGQLRYYGIRHEGAASFAASAYGKLTGRPAACFAIAGPGATNMYTGMWDAKNDRAPLLAFSGQVQTQVVGTGAFQEVDLVRAFQSVAEFNHRVQNNSKHAELMTLAIKHAILRRDVSHLTFPDEVQELRAKAGAKAAQPNARITNLQIAPPAEPLAEAVNLLQKARRPVIIVGHGARFDMEEITAFAERLNCPVLTTFKGKGLISDHHPLGCGVLGRSGTPIASWFMNEADLLLVIGSSFSNHTGITPKLPIIQIDFDPLVLAKFHEVQVQLYGEISRTMSLLKTEVGQTQSIDQREEVAHRWSLWQEEKTKRLQDDRGEGVSSAAIFDAMNQTMPANAVMTVDVGNNAYSFGRYFETKEQSFLMSGYLGSIGFGYPAAIGAWAAVGDSRPVVSVTGDGGFAQYMAEITTAVKYKMPIKHILINNHELGKISKEQRASELHVWQTSLVNPDFAAFASSCGALGIRVSQREELVPAMQQLLSHDGPGTLEIMADVALI